MVDHGVGILDTLGRPSGATCVDNTSAVTHVHNGERLRNPSRMRTVPQHVRGVGQDHSRADALGRAPREDLGPNGVPLMEEQGRVTVPQYVIEPVFWGKRIHRHPGGTAQHQRIDSHHLVHAPVQNQRNDVALLHPKAEDPLGHLFDFRGKELVSNLTTPTKRARHQGHTVGMLAGPSDEHLDDWFSWECHGGTIRVRLSAVCKHAASFARRGLFRARALN
mmetsp:Transcript_79705/g.221816  ORF Transcript_79705/g.221816 Transcript_79705/m.221816 type:complete len:221 (-) Transcript_79705:213-875(-)